MTFLKVLLTFFLISMLTFAAGMAYLLGVRIHPEALKQMGIKQDAPYYRLDFNGGQVMYARLLKEDSGELEVQIGPNPFTFYKSDLRSYRPATIEERASSDFGSWEKTDRADPLVTMKSEDNFFRKGAGMVKDLKEVASSLTGLAGSLKGSGLSSMAGGSGGVTTDYESLIREKLGKK